MLIKHLQLTRSFQISFHLGFDPAFKIEWHPHKSAKFVFNVSCNTSSLALTGWSLYSDTAGKGKIVWADNEINLTSNLYANRIAANQTLFF